MAILKEDDLIDDEFDGFVRKLITYMMEDPRTISASLDLLFLAKAIERIGDHSKNVAELIIYLVEGRMCAIRPWRKSNLHCSEAGGIQGMKKMPMVLIVEDEPAIAELIAVNLRHNGFQPVWAEDGVSAQRELDAVLPEVILLDWMLPGASGLSLARKWRADSRTKGVPILMLTARGDEPDKVAGWMPARMTTSPSRFPRRSCWRAFAPCCVAVPPSKCRTRSASASWCWTPRLTA